MRIVIKNIIIVMIVSIFLLCYEYSKMYPLIICSILGAITVFIGMRLNKDANIYFTKLKPEAKIPIKRDEDMGYDIYPCFDDIFITIMPHETKMIETGIGSVFSKKYGMILKERGSTGTKGIAQRCGVIDSGFRGEWKVPITNTTNKELVISKNVASVEENDDMIYYPYDKAICQAIVLPVPKVKVKEIDIDKFKKFKSKRGSGMLGSSGK